MSFGWRADNDPTLNAGLVALWVSRESGPVLLRNTIDLRFSKWRGGPDPYPPLDPLICNILIHQSKHVFWCSKSITHMQSNGKSLKHPYPFYKNPSRFAPDPVRPLDVSPQRRFAPGRFAPGRFAPLVVSSLVDSPQEEKSTYFVEIYVNS